MENRTILFCIIIAIPFVGTVIYAIVQMLSKDRDTY